MASNDLIFGRTPLVNPANLVFGAGNETDDRTATLDATFALEFSAVVGNIVEAEFAAIFPALTFSATATQQVRYVVRTTSEVATLFQAAVTADSSADVRHQDGEATLASSKAQHSRAIAARSGSRAKFQQGRAVASPAIRPRHSDADRLDSWLTRSPFQSAIRGNHAERSTHFTTADRCDTVRHSRFQDRYRDRRPRLGTDFQEAIGLTISRAWSAGVADKLNVAQWSHYQEAMQPGIGISMPPEPPQPEPCYEPDPNVVFQQDRLSNPAPLLFMCQYDDGLPEGTVVVPVKGVYVVINNVSLRRVSPSRDLSAFDVSLSIDCDSWTWGFSATVPASEQQYIMPDNNGPVELEAEINGTVYRLLAENLTRDRSFNSQRIRISGRGKSALLASPYSRVRAFTSNQQRTAQQLMNDVLSVNNVPLGWNIDWQIDDWIVPAGAFSMNGSYIDGITAISNAVGAYLQPHPVNQSISVLHKYPTAPWDWHTVTPDFDIPAAVMLQEGIEWIEKPDYNRVYVSGVSQGIMGRVTRYGTAGNIVAPMVTDPLITATAAARQRGRAELSDTGRQAKVSLRMPVLPETGIITPGKFVRYDDGSELRIGIVRATSIDAGWPEVWQSITLETHVS